ncbi:MAG TPA: LysR family transcriptional regulator [Candidatus Acidoferrales bacterium]|nr:LysR family transcriptional regulator [Candidatus Acidoferrales bacterium]
MELQQLKGFLAVVRTASVTEAAYQLHLTPSSISVQIKKLEQELGVRLFNRGRKQLTLTTSGKLFLENVAPAIENLRRAETLVKDNAGPVTGDIVIAAIYDIKQYYLPMLASFAKNHKQINLTILTGHNAEILSLLTSGQADFGMARMKPAASQFVTYPLITTHPRLVLPRDHFLYNKKKISLDDLRDCRFVFLPKSTKSRHLIEDRFYRSGYHLKVGFEAWSCADIIDCVLLGLGPGIVHDICIPRSARGLRTVDITTIFGSTGVNLIGRKNKFLSRADQVFIQTVLKYRKPKTPQNGSGRTE